MSPLTCREVEELLDEYGRGDLPRGQLEAVELHLAGCERCREATELWTGFTAALGSTELDPLPPLVERRIVVAAADTSTAESSERMPRIRRIAGIAAAAAVAAGIALFFALSPGDDPERADDSVVVDTGAEPDRPEAADRGQGSPAGEPSSAPGQGRQLIEVDDVTKLWIEEGSAVRVEHLEERLARFRLDAGRVLAEIGPHPDGFRFIVATPSGEVEAKGTIFAVEVDRRGVEQARVMRGAVEVRTGDEVAGEEPVRFLVRAGESGKVGDTEPSPLAPEEMGRDVCLLRGCTLAGEPIRVASAGPVAPATGEPCDPTQVEPPAPAHPTAPRPVPHPAGPSEATRRAGAAETAASTGSGAADPASAASPDDWEVETLVSLALSQRKAGMYPMAAETYRRLIREHSATAAARNALVSLGQLELVELGRPREALSLFESYLTRTPAGLLAEEARLGRVRAYARMGRSQDVVGAASDYLRIHLGGYAGAEVMRLRADAKRKLGDCLGAIEDYRQVQSLWPTSPQNRKAETGLAACRAKP